jgi:hypothetical protein
VVTAEPVREVAEPLDGKLTRASAQALATALSLDDFQDRLHLFADGGAQLVAGLLHLGLYSLRISIILVF